MAKYKFIFIYGGLLVLLFAVGIATFRIDWKVCQVCGLQRYDRYVFGMHIKGYSEGTVESRGRSEGSDIPQNAWRGDGTFDPDLRAWAYVQVHGEHNHLWEIRRASAWGVDADFERRRTVLPYPPPAEVKAYLDRRLAEVEADGADGAPGVDSPVPSPAPGHSTDSPVAGTESDSPTPK